MSGPNDERLFIRNGRDVWWKKIGAVISDMKYADKYRFFPGAAEMLFEAAKGLPGEYYTQPGPRYQENTLVIVGNGSAPSEDVVSYRKQQQEQLRTDYERMEVEQIAADALRAKEKEAEDARKAA
jgi:hypothetical protein